LETTKNVFINFVEEVLYGDVVSIDCEHFAQSSGPSGTLNWKNAGSQSCHPRHPSDLRKNYKVIFPLLNKVYEY
jgi:hypothetical protein